MLSDMQLADYGVIQMLHVAMQIVMVPAVWL